MRHGDTVGHSCHDAAHFLPTSLTVPHTPAYDAPYRPPLHGRPAPRLDPLRLLLPLAVMLPACAGSQTANPGSPGPAAAVAPLQQGESLLVLRAASDGAPLFPDEREQVRQRAVQFLTAQTMTPPLRLVPLEDIDALERTAAHGRRLESGPRCAAPLALADLLAERWPDVAQAEARLACSQEQCEIHLTVLRPRAGAAGTLATWRAKVAEPELAQGWVQAFSALAPLPLQPGSENVLSVVVEEDEAPRLELRSVRGFGPWSSVPDEAALAPLRTSLQACHDAGGSGATADRIVVAIGASGKVERCAVTSDQHPPRPEARACLCKVLTAMPFAAGSQGRRLTLSVRDRPDDVRSLNGRPVVVRWDDVVAHDGTPVASHLARIEPAIARCAAASPRESLRLAIHLEATPVGHLVAATARDLPSSQLPAPPPLLECVESVLRSVALPCAAGTAPLVVDAVLVLDARHKP